MSYVVERETHPRVVNEPTSASYLSVRLGCWLFTTSSSKITTHANQPTLYSAFDPATPFKDLRTFSGMWILINSERNVLHHLKDTCHVQKCCESSSQGFKKKLAKEDNEFPGTRNPLLGKKERKKEKNNNIILILRNSLLHLTVCISDWQMLWCSEIPLFF